MITFFAPPLMCAEAFSFVVKKPGALEHHVHAERAPGNLRRVALREDLDRVAVDDHGVALHLDGAGKLSMRRVVAREVRVRLRGPEVVHRDDLEIVRLVALVVRAKDVAADAAVAVDGDTDGHEGRLRER
jgi:hypothetical protein